MKRITLLVLAIALVSTQACKKDEPAEDSPQETPDHQTTSSEDMALAESLWDDAGGEADNSSESVEEGEEEWKSCATITVDTLGSPFPLQITVDFGESNCLGIDGKNRRGKLVYTLSNWYRIEGSELSLVPEDYYVNDYQVEGKRVATNLGENSSGQMHYGIKVTDGIITAPDGTTIEWESERTRTWVEGQNTGFFTPDGNGGFLGWTGITDDVYEITGTSNGVNRSGRSYAAEITTPLRVQLNCFWITSGVLEVTPNELETRTLDYGAGDCDNKALFSVGSFETQITLR